MMPRPAPVVEMPPRRAVVVEMQPRDGSARMRVLERSLAYEHCLGVLNGHCASAENEHGEECFDLESASPSSDIRALLNDVVRYLEWRGLLERNAKDPRWVIVHDEDPEVVA